jgi:hypothetical protein
MGVQGAASGAADRRRFVALVSRFERPTCTSRAICRSCGVSATVDEASFVCMRTVSPAARRSRRGLDVAGDDVVDVAGANLRQLAVE